MAAACTVLRGAVCLSGHRNRAPCATAAATALQGASGALANSSADKHVGDGVASGNLAMAVEAAEVRVKVEHLTQTLSEVVDRVSALEATIITNHNRCVRHVARRDGDYAGDASSPTRTRYHRIVCCVCVLCLRGWCRGSL